jgi:hypothetical protein
LLVPEAGLPESPSPIFGTRAVVAMPALLRNERLDRELKWGSSLSVMKQEGYDRRKDAGLLI